MTIDTTEYDFKGQLKYETIQFFFRRHWVRFVRPIFFSTLVGLLFFVILLALGRLVIFLDFTFLRAFFVFTVMIISVIYLNIFFLQIINFYFDLTIVTDSRIIITHKTVFMRDDSDAIDLTKIQDIAVETRGLFRNYLSYGQLIITLSTSAPPVIISYVPRPHFYLERANRVKREHILHRQEKRKGGDISISSKASESYLQDIHNLPDLPVDIKH